MAKRSDDEQNKHDQVITFIAQKKSEDDGIKVETNKGNSHNKEVDGYYPDLIRSQESTGSIISISEVETENTVNSSEAENQWKPYSELDYDFHLYIPEEELEKAQELCEENDISITSFGSYELTDDKLKVTYY